METKIGFSTPRAFNLVSWFVRKITRSTCSHTFFVYFDVEWGTDMVLEAHESCFRIIPLAHFEKQNKIIALVAVPGIEFGLKFIALEFLGSSYDFGGLLGSAVTQMGRWLKRKWGNPLNNSRSLFCSEAVVLVLQKTGYAGADTLIPEDTSPQDLLEFFIQQQGALCLL